MLKILALIVPVLSVPLGILSSQLGWFGLSIGELSDQQSTVLNILIQPADYAFSIWGAIYLGVLGLAVAQAFPPGSRNPRYVRARVPLVLNMVVNFCWFVATQREWGGVSAGLLWAQFGTAVWLYYALELPKTKVYGLERPLRVPFSLYAGWLTVATVLNAAGVLAVRGWDGFGLSYPVWGVVMLVVAAAIGLTTRFRWNDPVYGAVFVWALVGISVERADAPLVAGTALLLALLFVQTFLPTVGNALRPDSAKAV